MAPKANVDWLYDLISESVANLHGMVELYRWAWQRSKHPGIRGLLRDFVAEAQAHVQFLEEFLRVSGASRDYRSPYAPTLRFQAARLIDAGAPLKYQEISDLQAVLQIEAKSEILWLVLTAALPLINELSIREKLALLVEQLENEAQIRTGWIREALSSLHLERISAERAAHAA